MIPDHHADAFRRWGYLQADLDSLGRLAPFAHPDLDDLRDAEADRWRSICCGSIGARFIAERMEVDPPVLDLR